MNTIACRVLFRLGLPVILVASFLFRFNLFSLIYLLLLLVSPLLPRLTRESYKGPCGLYLKIVIACSIFFCCAQVVYQIVLLATGAYQNPLVQCATREKILNLVGLHRLNGITFQDCIRLFVMDFIVLIASTVVYVICDHVPEDQSQVPIRPLDEEATAGQSPSRKLKLIATAYAIYVGEFFVLVFLAASGIMQPSLISAVYLLTFLTVATWLGSNQKLGIGYFRTRWLLAVYSAIHLMLIYMYQFDYTVEIVDPESLPVRLLGLTRLHVQRCNTTSSEDDIRILNFRPINWTYYASPLLILGLYTMICTMSRYVFPFLMLQEAESQGGTQQSTYLWTRHTKSRRSSGLLDNDFVAKNYQTMEESDQKENSITQSCTSGGPDNIAPPVDMQKKLLQPSFGRFILAGLIHGFNLLAKGSYVGTLIIMMTWSITYHSWLTFVLLLWSCLLWMLPKTKRACLYSSPFLVFYAISLILLQFIYSLNLTDAELPRKSGNYNLSEIGLVKYPEDGYQPLSVKILYTVMFWITLRQYVMLRLAGVDPGETVVISERPVTPRRTLREPSIVSTIATAATPYIGYLVECTKKILTKYWIWVVAIMLMVMSLGGTEVVIYRIVYMFLFLFFILMFQFSFTLWTKVMYGFWLTVIIYSMLVLIIIYTYQFNNFPLYWETYLHIPKEMQQDIGLEVYNSDPGVLFVSLLTPTFFLVITIIQLHYFHEDFVKLNDPREAPYVVSSHSSPGTSDRQNFTDEVDQRPVKFQSVLKTVSRVYNHVSDIIWRLLEIHIVKIVLFSVFCLAVSDVCAIHVVFVVFVIIAMPLKSLQNCITFSCSLWASILLIAKMIYQLNFVDRLGWLTNCTDVIGLDPDKIPVSEPFNSLIDNRIWIGFQKTENLTYYCRGYVGLIVVFTIQAIVKIRQKYFYQNSTSPEPKPGILFPDITHNDANIGLLECMKYLINFFFYKFGVEFCLIMMAISAGIRLDIFGILTAIWLGIMICLRRSSLSKVWHVYVGFLCITIPLQYLMDVGLPAGLCIEYPWYKPEDSQITELVEWFMLPDYVKPPKAIIILVDFFQLLFACCQLVVFKTEATEGDNYEGGSNKEIFNSKGEYCGIKENPVPDYVTYTKSYLSMIKVLLCFSFYWVSLAIMFMAGTYRISIFGMGYILGCFLFLWYGTEFYVKPMKIILKMWNLLIGYNIGVIFIKSLLQLIGCMFDDNLKKAHLCWVTQLFGIACLKTQGVGPPGNIPAGAGPCTEPTDEAGLMWDIICFAFLIMQRRLFTSYNFQHIIIEVKVQREFASRGAELINEILEKDFLEQTMIESETMEKIKKKMDRIRESHKRNGKYEEPNTHFDAIRSGDYYLFQDEPKDDLDLEPPVSRRGSTTDDADMEEVKTRGLNAVISSVIKTGTVEAPPMRQISESSEGRTEPSQWVPVDPSKPQTTKKSPESPEDKPSSSYQSDTAEDDIASPGEDLIEEPKGTWNTSKKIGTILMTLFNSSLVSGTARLNHITKDYRYVARILAHEKRDHKTSFYKNGIADISDGSHAGSIHQSYGSFSECYQKQEAVAQRNDQMSRPDKDTTGFSGSGEIIDTPDMLDDEFQKDQPDVVRFLIAVYYTILSRSEFLCYFFIVINQIKYASLLSLPLPLMAFLWGSLSVPRSTKTFWVSIITYVEAVVVVKYFFQFNFINLDSDTSLKLAAYGPAHLIGIERRNDYAVYDLVTLLFVFFHQFMLKSLGLWKDTSQHETLSTSLPAVDDADKASFDSKKSDPSIKEDGGGDRICVDQDSPKAIDEASSKVPKSSMSYVQPFKNFFVQLFYSKYRIPKDVYAYMFFCDFLNFLIILFGYWNFDIPIPFLLMLITQFGLIVVDRALYLRKFLLGKLIFQVLQVLFVHIWLFFAMPAVGQGEFVDKTNLPPKLWYFVKCMYFLISAYQIRCGYPTRILGNFFTKKYNYINYIFFQGYMVIPFLYELRSLMDWIWTDTSMTLFSWLKMENIFANIFLLKCARRAEDEYPTPRGSKRAAIVKYGLGGGLLFGIILVIWLPLLVFALGNAVGQSILPYECSLELSLNGYQPIFKLIGQNRNNSFQRYNSNQFSDLVKKVKSSISSMNFLSNYDQEDIVVVKLNGNSAAIWTISPPSQLQLIQQLNGTDPIEVRVAWSFSRNNDKLDADKTVNKEFTRNLTVTELGELRRNLSEILSGNVNISATIPHILPKYVKVPRKGTADMITLFEQKYDDNLSNVTIRLRTGEIKGLTSTTEWWEVQEECSSQDCDKIHMTAFIDKVFPPELSMLSSYGIIGMYTAVVLVLSRFIRNFISGTSYRIIFDDMPNVDHILQMCLDLYLVRENCDLALEEDIFAKLIFLFRSPETLIKWTRKPIRNQGNDQ